MNEYSIEYYRRGPPLYSPACVAGVYLIKFFNKESLIYPLHLTQLYSPSARCNVLVHNGSPPPVWRIRIILIRPDPGCAKFVIDPDPGCEKNLLWIRIRIQGELWNGSGSRQKRYGSGSSKQEDLEKVMKNAHNPCFVGVYYLTITCL